MFREILGSIPRRLRHSLVRMLLDDPQVRHFEPSVLMCADDLLPLPTRKLVDLCLKAANLAAEIDISAVAGRAPKIPGKSISYIDLWPGEHYRLLAALVKLMSPKVVIEIGTAEGLSALSMLRFLPHDGRIVTFDIIPWQEYSPQILTSSDFADGRLTQFVDDLSDAETFRKHIDLISQADLIFIDGPKNGLTEAAIVAALKNTTFRRSPIVVFDDIRFLNMIDIWRELRKPRLDLGSFGHWTGTGIVEW